VTVPETDVRLDGSDRLERALRVIPYLLLAVSTLLASIADDLVAHRSVAHRLARSGWPRWPRDGCCGWSPCTRPGRTGAG
jgi:hypothetical protein